MEEHKEKRFYKSLLYTIFQFVTLLQIKSLGSLGCARVRLLFIVAGSNCGGLVVVRTKEPQEANKQARGERVHIVVVHFFTPCQTPSSSPAATCTLGTQNPVNRLAGSQ